MLIKDLLTQSCGSGPCGARPIWSLSEGNKPGNPLEQSIGSFSGTVEVRRLETGSFVFAEFTDIRRVTDRENTLDPARS